MTSSQTTQRNPGGTSGLPLVLARATKVVPPARLLSVDYVLIRRALLLAIGSLLLAGCFSLFLIIGRLPVISPWITDPLFFKRCLVLHVDLALIVWFFSFAAGLYALLPGDRASHALHRAGLTLAGAGVLAMIGGTLIPGTAPVLANYVPVIDHPLYVGGVALFFGGILLAFINDRLFTRMPAVADGAPASAWEPLRLTPDAAAGLKTAALAFLLAVTMFLVARAATPRGIEVKAFYELVFWGGGHVLQVANVATMLAVWLLLLSSRLRSAVLPPAVARILFALLLAPHLIGPLLTLEGTVGATYRLGFTRLMQFGIAPVVLVVMVLCVRRLRRAWRNGDIGARDWRDPRLVGFVMSAALTLTGFALGASIHGSNTMIPAHYHASIGAVTVALMAVSYPLLRPLGLASLTGRRARLIPWQLGLFGGGQVIFALGFALGGLHGLDRKAYAGDQYVRSFGELAGIGVMATGGLIAVVGGLLYLALMVSAVKNRRDQSRPRTDRSVGMKEFGRVEHPNTERSRPDACASHSIPSEPHDSLPIRQAQGHRGGRSLTAPLSNPPLKTSTRSHP